MAYPGESNRTYAVVFWGFVESGKKRKSYAVKDFVSQLEQFMARLVITRAPLAGQYGRNGKAIRCRPVPAMG
jgi:hypothetical protein